MANTVITYPAQKLTIKSMRGNHFKLVINVKDSGGSNYDFTSDTTDTTLADTAEIKIRNKDGSSTLNYILAPEDTSGTFTIDSLMDLTVEDGKITIEWGQTYTYAPWPGKYKYHMYTTDANDKETIWLYGDFVVVDNNLYIEQDGIQNG